MKTKLLDLSSDHLYEDMIKRAKWMGGDEHPSGFARLVDSTVALEQALAVLIKCQAVQTNTCLMLINSEITPYSYQLLVSWLEASNRALETMIMYHWITLTRQKGIFPYWLVSYKSGNNEGIPHTFVEAKRQTVMAAYALAEAKIQLVCQLMSKLQQSPSLVTRGGVVEKEALLTLHKVEDVLRLLGQKHSLLTTLDQDQDAAVDTSLKEIRSSLFASVKKLEAQMARVPFLSKDLISNLKKALTRLLEFYSVPQTSAQVFFQAEPPLPEPWLNEKVFGRHKKGR